MYEYAKRTLQSLECCNNQETVRCPLYFVSPSNCDPVRKLKGALQCSVLGLLDW